jgi:hypothetical protein
MALALVGAARAAAAAPCATSDGLGWLKPWL